MSVMSPSLSVLSTRHLSMRRVLDAGLRSVGASPAVLTFLTNAVPVGILTITESMTPTTQMIPMTRTAR